MELDHCYDRMFTTLVEALTRLLRKYNEIQQGRDSGLHQSDDGKVRLGR